MSSNGLLRVPRADGPVDLTVEVPGSKSVANRALVAAALGYGTSEIHRCAPGADTDAMIAGLSALGIGIDRNRDQVRVTGSAGHIAAGSRSVHAGLAGTTSRFLTAVAALGREPILIDGDPPLRRRPMAPLHDALEQLGARIVAGVGGDGHRGVLPVEVCGPIRGGVVSLAGDVSSQYVTALMLIGPLLAEGIDLRLTSPLVSRPYVEMTAAVMRVFGATEILVERDRVRVAPGGYRGIRYEVEPDASSASYPLALVGILGGRVRIPGLGRSSLQGDAIFADLLAQMGCQVDYSEASVTVDRDISTPLHGIEVNLSDASDLVPTVAVVAATAASPTRISGVGFIRSKESDRLGDLAAELRRLGVGATEEPDGLLIRPSDDPLHGARIETHHDHRLAMAFGVLGTAVDGIEVIDPAVVAKSWPRFWQELDRWIR